jgi:succinate---hydroxymethylglutarate CoA-transferase
MNRRQNLDGDLSAGLYTHGAILAALRQRDRTGLGAKIEGSLFETSLGVLPNVGLAALYLDKKKGPEARRRAALTSYDFMSASTASYL